MLALVTTMVLGAVLAWWAYLYFELRAGYLILREVSRRGPLSTYELKKSTGLSPLFFYTVLRQMVDEGTLARHESDCEYRGGRPLVTFSIAATKVSFSTGIIACCGKKCEESVPGVTLGRCILPPNHPESEGHTDAVTEVER